MERPSLGVARPIDDRDDPYGDDPYASSPSGFGAASDPGYGGPSRPSRFDPPPGGRYATPRPTEPDAPAGRKKRGPWRNVLIVGVAATATAVTVIAAALLPRRGSAGGGGEANLLQPPGGEPPPERTTWANADAVGCTLPLRARSRFFARREDSAHQRYLDTGTRVTILEVSDTTSNGIDHKCRVRLAGGDEGWVFIGGNEISACPRRPAAGLEDGFAAPLDDGPLEAAHFGYGPERDENVLALARGCAAAYLAMGGPERAAVWAAVGARPPVPEDEEALAAEVAGWLASSGAGDPSAVDGFAFCRAVAPAVAPALGASPPAPHPEPDPEPSEPPCTACAAGDPAAESAAGLPAGYAPMHGPAVTPEAAVLFDAAPRGVRGLWASSESPPVVGAAVAAQSTARAAAPRRPPPAPRAEEEDAADVLYGR